MSFFVYVLENNVGRIYIGQTDDLERRLRQHNDREFDRRSFTKLHKGPWKLVYSEQFTSRTQALLREKQLKSHKGRDWLRQEVLGP